MSGARTIGTITRRSAVGLMAAGGLGFALFGPRRAGEAPPGRTVIDYWEKWTGQEADAMRRVVDEFNRTQDRIWVRYFSMSAIDQKALVAIAGGRPPDLVGLWNFSLPAFMQSNALIPVEELADAYGDEISQAFRERYGDDDFRLRRDYYAPRIWDMMHERGRMGGVVNTCNTLALYYSRHAFREVGLDPDRPPRTIEELDQYAERLSRFDARGRVDRAGFLHREPGWWNWIWGFFFGGRLWDPEHNRATAAAPENVRAYEWLQSYPEKYGSSRLVQFQSGFGGYTSTQQPLLADKVAMALHGSFLANVINRFRPDFDYGAAPFPVHESVYDPDRPVSLVEFDLLTIPRGCPHPREAFEFMMFTQRRGPTELLATAHAKPSPLAESSPGFAAAHPNRYAAMHNALAASPRAFPKPLTPVWQEYESEFNAAIDALWNLADPAEAILERVERRAQRFIDHAAEQRHRRDGGRA